ncbi:unnamed protein product [Chondrus crispus]|uniref:Actin-related protein 8 n=1 Tax=Chondrus crispus TaxID=2769 RepID=R7QJ43_CHOCR|nr:unnamed protein product [Chondrus crispus]CDF38109.1 unnamed protein product [Chondrus crispus]|eukprot:XP_005717978.1 unnamed protein product [Chondrus crispus]
MAVPPDVKERKPPPANVVVLAFGSHGIRYGFAVDTTPRRLFPAVAFPRRPEAIADPAKAPVCIPTFRRRAPEDVQRARAVFAEMRNTIEVEMALRERRRGGGRPTPWTVVIEPISAPQPAAEADPTPTVKQPHPIHGSKVLVGRDVELLVRDKEKAKLYDIVFPIWDGKVLFDCGAPASLIRKALDALIAHIVEQLAAIRKKASENARKKKMNGDVRMENGGEEVKTEQLFTKDGVAGTFVALVVPETSQRRDTAEIVDAVFREPSLQTAAVFIHQSAVSCALGAGLATCAVVDIGHSATTVACVEDGLICGESRIHLNYGSWHIQNAFNMLLTDYSNLREVLQKEPGPNGRVLTDVEIADDQVVSIAKIAEQTGGFNVDENDTLTVAMVKLPSGRAIRVKLGVGMRALPCYGLIYPRTLSSASTVMTMQKNIPKRRVQEMNAADDNYVSDIFNDLRRSLIATNALAIGTFSNDPGHIASSTVDPQEASIVDAIIWSVAKAVEVKRPDQQSRTAEHYRKYLNAIVLAGGGASIDGVALALEARIKKGFLDAGLNVADVTVIDGGKGKGDEELAAAAAVLEDVTAEGGLVDDTDTASLPWKGGAVMVEADAVSEYWIYRHDWEDRNVRALRERAPFYW